MYQVGAKDSILGCDYAGTVAAVGSSVSGWQVGDKACGFIHGGKFADKGSFAQYGVVKGGQAYKVPSNLSMEAAPTYGVAYSTAGMVSHSLAFRSREEANREGKKRKMKDTDVQVLYHEQKVPYPPAKVEGDKWVC